jgi:hypothetical protein
LKESITLKPANIKFIFRPGTLIIFALALASCERDPGEGVQAAELYGDWDGLSNEGMLSLRFFVSSSGRDRYELLAPEGLSSENVPLDNVLSGGYWAVSGQELQLSDDGTGGLNCPGNIVDTYEVILFNKGANFTLEHLGLDCVDRGILINSVTMWTRTDE